MTGSSRGDGTGADYTTIAYDMATGEEVWSALYDGIGFTETAEAVAVDSTPEAGRRVFVTGSSQVTNER